MVQNIFLQMNYKIIQYLYQLGVSITLLHIRPSELAASYETGVEISPLFESILTHLQKFTKIQKNSVNKFLTLAKVTLVLPATDAACERSFSMLRLIKSYFRLVTRTHHVILCDQLSVVFYLQTTNSHFLFFLSSFLSKVPF